MTRWQNVINPCLNVEVFWHFQDFTVLYEFLPLLLLFRFLIQFIFGRYKWKHASPTPHTYAIGNDSAVHQYVHFLMRVLY